MTELGCIEIWLVADKKDHLLASTNLIPSHHLASMWWALPVNYYPSMYVAKLSDTNGKVIDEVFIESSDAAELLSIIHNKLIITSTTNYSH